MYDPKLQQSYAESVSNGLDTKQAYQAAVESGFDGCFFSWFIESGAINGIASIPVAEIDDAVEYGACPYGQGIHTGKVLRDLELDSK